MMDNRTLKAAQQFHQGTKHPGGHLLNPAHPWQGERPELFKSYEGGQQIPLEINREPLGVPALTAIQQERPEGERQTPDLETVARLLFFSAGITKRISFASKGGTIAFRAASCTGALFHIELYVVCGDLPGLAAGVYHFDPRGPALTRLREGDFRSHLVRATGDHPAVATAPLTLVYGDVFWRNAIKYQARAYRHAFWDSGTVLSHTLAMAAAHGLPAQVVAGFVDEQVNRLLGLDPAREAALELVPVGSGGPPPPEPAPLEALPEASGGVGPSAPFPAILTMHAASLLETPEEVRQWRGLPPPLPLPEPRGQLFPLEPTAAAQDPLEAVILRRGSSRRFHRRPVSFGQLSTILARATAGVPADFTDPPHLSLNHVYLIATAVDGLPTGAYRFHPDRLVLELLHEDVSRHVAAHLSLGQNLGADAAVSLYFLSPLDPVLERFGNRGYRAAQMEASIAAGRVYLATYALELGATGLTFFDDAVVDLFSSGEDSAARELSVMFLMALGQPAPRSET